MRKTLIAAVGLTLVAGATQAQVRFDRIDGDDDGYLSYSEMAEVFGDAGASALWSRNGGRPLSEGDIRRINRDEDRDERDDERDDDRDERDDERDDDRDERDDERDDDDDDDDDDDNDDRNERNDDRGRDDNDDDDDDGDDD